LGSRWATPRTSISERQLGAILGPVRGALGCDHVLERRYDCDRRADLDLDCAGPQRREREPTRDLVEQDIDANREPDDTFRGREWGDLDRARTERAA